MGSCFGQACQVLSKLRIGDREQWLGALGRSIDKPQMEYCEDQNGTIIFTRALKEETAKECRRKREV